MKMNFVALFIYKVAKGECFFKDLRRHISDTNLVKGLDRLLTIKCRLVRSKCREQFLVACQERGIYTSGLISKIQRNRLRPSTEICDRYQQSELYDIRQRISSYTAQISLMKGFVSSLSLLMFCRYQKFTKGILDRVRQQESKRQTRIMSHDSICALFPLDNVDKRIVNLSSHELSGLEKQALINGLDFCVAPVRVDRNLVDAEVEKAFRQCSDLTPFNEDNIPALKANLVRLSAAYSRTPIDRGILSRRHLEAVERLRKKDDLMILKPDKGNGVVLMDRCSYVSKMNDILKNESKFKVDIKQKDRSKKLSSSVNDLVKRLQNLQILRPEQARCFTRSSQIPRLYGLPKLHKTNIPLRPILSMSGSPVHSLSRWLVDKLKPVQEFFTQFTVKDSFLFADMVRDIDLSSVTMYSFDVQSLFTNVPVYETVELIIDAIQKYQIPCDVPIHVLREGLLLCTTGIQFLFDGKLYTQVDGVAMGSCLGPVLADIFMGIIETRIQSIINDECKLYVRYVDDCFLLLENEKNVDDILSHFNNVHPNIVFTYETECNDRLPFLDVLITRAGNGTSHLSIYRKPTWSGIYTNFRSFVPTSYKVGLIKSLVSRARKICSTGSLQQEIQQIVGTLKENGYPSEFIERHMPSAVTVPKEYGPERKRILLKLPFIGDKTALRFKKCFSNAFHEFPCAKIVCLFSTRRLPVPSPKDRLPVLSNSNVIYKFACTCGCSYIGRTSRCLRERVTEHMPQWLNTVVKRPPRATKTPSSSITRHLQSCKSFVDTKSSTDCFKVMYRPTSFTSLQVIEALLIKRLSPELCTQKETVISLLLPW